VTTKALQPDDLIAHYRVIRALGAGGMGEVYLARDSTLDRDVALKVLPQMAQEDDRVKRFVLEAKAASSLSHPHIITVYEIGCEPIRNAEGTRSEKVHYIAMELVAGDTLGDIIHGEAEHKADLKTLLGYLAQAADGLAKAHASGIVHRDLKPGNIMVTKDGYAKVLDFGLAKLVEKEQAPDATINVATKQALTVEGMIVGTIGYMAPEQILGRPVDHRSDIFSFGCILYEGITKQRPFTANSQFEALQKIIHENPTPLESFVPDAPVDLRQLVARCLAKAPDDRIPSMKDVSSELRRIAGSYEVLARSAGSATDATVFYPAMPSGAIPPPSGAGTASAYAAYPSTQVQAPGALPSGVAPSTVILPAKKKLPIAAIAGVAVVVLALAGFLVYKFVLGKSGGLSDQALSQMKIASVLSNELLQGIAVSPDGRYAAYVSLANTKYQLQVRQISTGQDIPIVKPQDAQITDLAFSPDGDHLWFVAPDTENNLYSSLFEVPSVGGVPKRAVRDADTAPTFSPDGKSIAFMRGMPQEKKTSLIVHGLEDGSERVVTAVTGERDIAIDKPRWSPDGMKIATVSTVDPRRPNVVVFDVASGKEEPIGNWDGPVIDSVAWMGPDGLVVAGSPTPGPPQLWYLSYPGGDRRRLSNDTSQYQFVSTSADGKTIAARRTQRAAEIWQVPSDGQPGDMKQVTTGKENISSIGGSTDGTLVFIAPQEDSITVWSVKPTGGGRTSIAPKGTSVLAHKFIRAQDATAFTAYGADLVGHIYRVSVDGSNPKQLTKGSGENLVAVTPDGEYLLYNTPSALRTLMVLASDGHESSSRQLVTDYIDGLIFSKDSKLVSYNRLDTSQKQVMSVRTVVSFADGKVVVPTLPARNDYQFTPDGTAFSFIQPAPPPKEGALPVPPSVMKVPLAGGTPEKLFDLAESRIDVHRWVDEKNLVLGVRSTTKPVSNLWRWTVGSAKPLQLTNFPTGALFELAPSQDGKLIYFTQGSNNRDIIKITGLK
jgi:serine/threonine protein kinase/Tol biopolymer transport system component